MWMYVGVGWVFTENVFFVEGCRSLRYVVLGYGFMEEGLGNIFVVFWFIVRLCCLGVGELRGFVAFRICGLLVFFEVVGCLKV